jgi:hypothetical protein
MDLASWSAFAGLLLAVCSVVVVSIVVHRISGRR